MDGLYGKYADAASSYTAAVAAGSSHPLSAAFSAVCLCNRAAAAHAEVSEVTAARVYFAASR
jgi:hypothetical protein